jgi:hypothetical protein
MNGSENDFITIYMIIDCQVWSQIIFPSNLFNFNISIFWAYVDWLSLIVAKQMQSSSFEYIYEKG